ncbi:hypothetical protein WN55_09722 [Dufourea novaeangliae]|uniref:Uncharacterized protein n=2 Tax=Dufourea novaeangliae TaxID=178035 RepID=A0A154NZ78_DUFNO|nr:hypothetical protein WN55_09722 [Dufourea novaeangliae]
MPSYSVHLKILVPDIIKHHIHTKVVFLHVHKPKKPKTHHKEYHHENWSSWSSYGHHHDHKDEEGEQFDDHEDQSDRERLEMEDPQNLQGPKKHVPMYGYHRDNYPPKLYLDVNNLDTKNRGHGQYAVHEDVNDIPPNKEVISYNYEEGYSKGLQSESGHIRSGQSNKFHDDHHEEQEDNDNDGFKENSDGKTDAGRYLVDDVDYQNTRDKRDRGRRRRRFRKL